MSDTSTPIETVKDFEALFESAINGDPTAQHHLATIFEDGNHGLARKYYQEAVNQGYPKAEHDLGVMLRHGKGGDKDTAMALKLFLSALNKRHKQSMDYINELENLTDSMIAEMDIMKTLFFLDREIKEFKINKNKAILLNSRKFYKKHKRQEKN